MLCLPSFVLFLWALRTAAEIYESVVLSYSVRNISVCGPCSTALFWDAWLCINQIYEDDGWKHFPSTWNYIMQYFVVQPTQCVLLMLLINFRDLNLHSRRAKMPRHGLGRQMLWQCFGGLLVWPHATNFDFRDSEYCEI